MFTPDPFPQFVPNRVAAALRRLEDRIWSDQTPVSIEASTPSPEHVRWEAGRRLPLKPVRPLSAWGRLYDQRWCRLALPPADRRVPGPWFLEWRDQGEATLYVKGVPYYGLDVAHRYAPLPDKPDKPDKPGELWVESFCCQSAIWHPQATGLSARGSVFEGAFIVRRNEEAWSAYHDLKCLFDVMMWWRSRQTPVPPAELARFGLQPTLEQTVPVHRRLLHLLSEAVDALDLGGLSALRKQLAAAYRELRDPLPRSAAVLTGHAHIDLVWLWPERMGEAKAVHTFATVNRLMERYPEFRFAYSQTASYRVVGERSPELLAAVRERIRRRRWQATGALEVESDTQLPCGEALARSFLLGQEDFKKLRGGEPAKLLWLPDVFGYTGCLPQLMKLAGVPWFFTTKLTWSAVTRFPYSSFRWRGTDGSEVIAHVTPGAGYNNRVDVGELHAQAEGHMQAGVHPEFLHPTGYGDGGGGPTEEMCERARRLDSLAGMPALRWGHPEDFFAALEKRAALLPVHQGECYLEYHRGTYTTHGNLKAAYRALERALQVREAVAVVRGLALDLRPVWRRLVFAQFHDYLPGSSVAEVYAEGVPELERLAREQRAAAAEELATGEPKGRATHVFNPLTLPWRGWVTPPGGEPVWIEAGPLASVALAKAEGAREPKVDGDLRAPPVAQRGPNAPGGRVPPQATAHPARTWPIPARANGRMLENGIVRAEVDAQGRLRTLAVDGHAVALSDPAAVPVVYADVPSNYEAWDVDRHSLDLGQPATGPVEITAAGGAGERAAIVVKRALGRRSALTMRYVLAAGEPVLRLELELDWRETQTLLKLHFPTAYRGALARFGAPFGSVLRGQLPGAIVSEAQWENPGSRWAVVSHDGEREGLMLMTEAKYGFSARSGNLSVSLVRSARITGCDDHRYAAPRGLGRLQVASPYSDQGAHTIRLAIGRYDLGAPRERQPATLAETLFVQPLFGTGAVAAAGYEGLDGGETLIPAWAMPVAKSAWVLRLHECGGQAGTARVKLASGWTAQRCGLDGTLLPRAGRGTRVRFRPYEIVSLRIERAR